MTRIGRYIFRQLAWSMLLIGASLTCIVWLTQSLKLIDMIVNRGLPPALFMYMSALVLPNFLSLILPITLFTAVLFTYNKLLLDSELVVLRACGMSHGTIAAPALSLAVIVSAVAFLGVNVLMPIAYREFNDTKQMVRDNYSAVVLEEGVFNSLMDGVTVFVRARAPSGELLGIVVHDEREPSRAVTMMAERGALLAGEGGPRVLMINGNRQQVGADGGPTSLLYFDRYVFEIGRSGAPTVVRTLEPRERFLGQLLHPRDGFDSRARAQMQVEGHYRIASPFYALSFAFIGLAFLLCGDFNRRGVTLRIVAAAVVVALIEGLGVALKSTAPKFPALIPLIYVNAFLPIPIGAYFLARSAVRRRVATMPALATSG